MSADQYPTGTVARVRVGEWEGRAARRVFEGTPVWLLLGHPAKTSAVDATTTVLHVELPAPIEEPKAFGARVSARVVNAVGAREWLRSLPDDASFPWTDRFGSRCAWSDLTNPVILHDPEATA